MGLFITEVTLMKKEKNRKRKLNTKRIRALSAIMFTLPFILSTLFLPAIKAGATDIPDGTPTEYNPAAVNYSNASQNEHVRTDYVYSLADHTYTNQQSGEIVGNSGATEAFNRLPILFPGDTVTIIPEEVNKDHNTGYVGLILNLKDVGITTGDHGPIHVLKTASYGEPVNGKNTNGSSYIQKIQIVGDSPVSLSSYAGGGWTTRTVNKGTANEYTLNYYAKDFTYTVLPKSCNISYLCVIPGTGAVDASDCDLFYPNGGNNPACIYAEDALTNGLSAGPFSFTVEKPYLEGYNLNKTTNNYAATGGKTKSAVYDYATDNGAGYSVPEVTVYPKWRYSSGSKNENLSHGSTSDVVNIEFEFSDSKTLTLNANGGTIDGLAKKIYIVNNVMLPSWNISDYVPERENYTFDGWYTDLSDESTKITDLSATLNKYGNSGGTVDSRACRLYAKWTADDSGDIPGGDDDIPGGDDDIPGGDDDIPGGGDDIPGGGDNPGGDDDNLGEPAQPAEIGDSYIDPVIIRIKLASPDNQPEIIEYDQGGEGALPIRLMAALKEHPNVTFIYHCTYEGIAYTFTIKGSAAIVDEKIPWYGPLWLRIFYPTVMKPIE